MTPLLESLTQSLNYGELPETWRVPEIEHFSPEKTLYDYQTDALRNAARALYLYYGKAHDWCLHEPASINHNRKQHLYGLYDHADFTDIKKYETRADKNNHTQQPVFRILDRYFPSFNEAIPYHHLINRMCFWMATGSGKTLVMVKLIEYLHGLIKHREIPPHNLLVLAPSDTLLRQIRHTVNEFNRRSLHIELVPLRDIHRPRQGQLGETITVYYHRSDNISDVQKDALTDYRTYENDGKWYVLLDEAHKGGKENSKRQAYYAVMARQGFLFNFSATFTDAEDIATTVKKYNLEAFIKNGHGKNIYLNQSEYTAFRGNNEEINLKDRQEIVLQSLITLAFLSRRVDCLRRQTGLAELYHAPLMLTLVNSVNTVENNLLAFFQTLREIAGGEIDQQFFAEVKQRLINNWRDGTLLFGENDAGIDADDTERVRTITISDLRRAVFAGSKQGAIEVIRSTDKRDLALQIKNADAPFALIRIGDTSKWRKDILAGYEETKALQETAFFDALESSPIKILMGSRSFFESWDSNRPNVINFINIGGIDAEKFVVQSVGRGVRIEPLPGKRRRLASLATQLNAEQQALIKKIDLPVQPPETLFLFATNRQAIKAVLAGLEGEKTAALITLEGFEKADAPLIGEKAMPLLIPEYKDAGRAVNKHPFTMSQNTKDRLRAWFQRTSDAVLVIRDGLDLSRVSELRAMAVADNNKAIKIEPDKEYASLPFLQARLISHLDKTAKQAKGVRSIVDDDIVHFRQIRVQSDHADRLQQIIDQVKQGRPSDDDISRLAGQLAAQEITREEFDRRSTGKNEDTFKDLTIKKLASHYYLPVVLGDEKADYIQHIINIKSEVRFLQALEAWLQQNKPQWDGWMFSKIDESLDDVHMPYYDEDKKTYRRFLPDFVFWMCRGNKYRIVFVDPKGDAHSDAYHKIDGYKKLFVENGKVRRFKHGKHEVSVHLLYYNPGSRPLDEYIHFWMSSPQAIFNE